MSEISAVIIAAGMGIRLKSISADIPKPMTPVAGIPLLERIIKTGARAGIKRFGLVVGFQAQLLRDWLKAGNQWGVEINYVFNPEWEKNNGISAYCAHSLLSPEEDNFILMMADHLFNPQMLEGLLADNSPKNLLAVDKSIDRIFDLEDATKVFCQGKKIIRIGKLIPEYNGVDCGLFKLKKNFFPAQKKAIDRGLDQLSHGIQVLLDEGDFEAHFIRDNCHWLDVDTIEALKYAQNNIHLFE